MDYKTYSEDSFKRVSGFDRVFKPWKKWQDVKLTDICPCDNCEIYKNYEAKALYGNIAERQYAKLPDSCPCIDKLHWKMECLEKLKWYEDNDSHLKT